MNALRPSSSGSNTAEARNKRVASELARGSQLGKGQSSAWEPLPFTWGLKR